MRALSLPGSPATTLPVLGLGTWRLGEQRGRRDADIATVRQALELGYRLVDTAEMYGEGGAETVVGRALADALRAGDLRRDEVTVVSKVYPHNASRRGTAAACDRSRQRLGLDRIDLYLLHWRGVHPLAETAQALQALVDRGSVGRWGVSNFDVADLDELRALRVRGDIDPCATNQVYYALSERGPDHSLLPWMRERAMPLMAYSPIDQGRLAADRTLAQIGERLGLSAAQVALAWVTSRPGVMAVAKASSEKHLRDNLVATGAVLGDDEMARLDARFPAPTAKTPLAMI